MTHSVVLSCLACNGRLRIAEDVQSLVCVHCGQPQLVKRAGGLAFLVRIRADLPPTGTPPAPKVPPAG